MAHALLRRSAYTPTSTCGARASSTILTPVSVSRTSDRLNCKYLQLCGHMKGWGVASGELGCRPMQAVHSTSTASQATSAQPVASSPTQATGSGHSQAAQTSSPAVDDFAVDGRPVILYDGVCNLCNAAVDFMLTWDKPGRFRMAALQSAAGQRLLQRCGRQPSDISSIVVVEQHRHHIQSDAILRIAQDISNPFPLLALFGWPFPKPLRDFLYDQVADNRYSFLGKRKVCRLSNAGFEDRFITD